MKPFPNSGQLVAMVKNHDWSHESLKPRVHLLLLKEMLNAQLVFLNINV